MLTSHTQPFLMTSRLLVCRVNHVVFVGRVDIPLATNCRPLLSLRLVALRLVGALEFLGTK